MIGGGGIAVSSVSCASEEPRDGRSQHRQQRRKHVTEKPCRPYALFPRTARFLRRAASNARCCPWRTRAGGTAPRMGLCVAGAEGQPAWRSPRRRLCAGRGADGGPRRSPAAIPPPIVLLTRSCTPPRQATSVRSASSRSRRRRNMALLPSRCPRRRRCWARSKARAFEQTRQGKATNCFLRGELKSSDGQADAGKLRLAAVAVSLGRRGVGFPVPACCSSGRSRWSILPVSNAGRRSRAAR